MRKVKVWRYYCDFCNKGSCSGGHLKRHEESCTMNPKRICRMCIFAGLQQQPISDLINALGKGDEEGLKKLRNLADGCPVCILAAIRQSKLQHADEEGCFYIGNFNFHEERKKLLDEVNKYNQSDIY